MAEKFEVEFLISGQEENLGTSRCTTVHGNMMTHPTVPVLYFLLSVVLTVLCLAGDSYLKNLPPNSYHTRAAVDSFVHSVVGGISWILVIITQHDPKGLFLCRNFALEVFLCLILAGAVDVDHFILARSLHIKDAFNLPHRPPFHCTSTLLLLCASLSSVSYFTYNERLNRISWIILTAGLTHHLRDANRRGLWFAPFGSTPPIPWPIYITCIICCPLIVCCLMHFTALTPKVQDIMVAQIV